MTKTNERIANTIFSNGRYNKGAPSLRPKVANEIFSKKTNSKVGLEEAQKNSPYNNSKVGLEEAQKNSPYNNSKVGLEEAQKNSPYNNSKVGLEEAQKNNPYNNSKVGLEEAQENSPYHHSPRLSKSVNSIKPSYPSKTRKGHFSKNSKKNIFSDWKNPEPNKKHSYSPTTKNFPNGGKKSSK